MSPILYTFRLTLYSLTLLSVSFLAVLIGILATICGQRLNTNYYVARTFYYVAGFIMGWKIEVEGEEHLWKIEDEEKEKGRSAVLLGNHQSFVDILYLGRIFPKHAAIMAKKELKWLPGLGWFMALSGTVFINRGNNKSAIASMTQAGDDMKRRRISLWIFPEGTRNNTPEPALLPFKKGAFYLAVQSGVPIVPVVCQNYNHLFDGKTRFRRGSLRIRVLPPIPTTGLTPSDVPALVEKTHGLMLAALKDLSSPSTPSSPSSTTSPLISSRSDGYQSIPNPTGNEAADSSVGEVSKGQKVKTGKLAIAMVSDFFLPVVGGVENHIYSLGVELMRRGHRVIVITHHHPTRTGIHYLSPGLKVYHLPIVPIASSATLPNFLLFLPWLRNILLRERIDLVHGHGSLSSMAHEAMFHAPLFGVKTVFTDHSLFGFSDAVGVLTNKLLAGALRNVDEVICVSNTGRENTVLRAELHPSTASVIPNALIAEQFQPDPSQASSSHITIVVISRLVYRKGIDLLVASAPQICALYPEVRFIVGGDGPKMVELEQMREKYLLQDRIQLLGSIPPADVRNVLVQGHIYLSTSLTESFGISILEASSCGLYVVATKVGGVPEILPRDMIEFSKPDEDDITRALIHAVQTIKSGKHDPIKAHDRVKGMYSWQDVSRRTEIVYERAMAAPHKDTFERLSRYLTLGPVFGSIMCITIAVEHYFFWILEWMAPRGKIDCVKEEDIFTLEKLQAVFASQKN